MFSAELSLLSVALQMWDDEDLGEQVWAQGSTHDVLSSWVIIAVLSALTNAVLLAILILNKDTRTPSLINIVAGDLIAVLCLPFNVIHHFLDDWPLGSVMCSAFLILRDVSAAVQSFSFVMISLLNFVKVNESLRSMEPDLETKASDVLVRSARQIPAFLQIFVVWFSAICCSSVLAVLSQDTCSVYFDYLREFEEDSVTKSAVTFRCLAFGIVPVAIITLFLVMAACRKSVRPNNNRIKNHDGKLLLGFVIVFTVNNISGYTASLSVWSVYTPVTKIFIDYAMFFPVYLTTFYIPLLLYYTTPSVSSHFRYMSCGSSN
jgi:hypothetical protein